MWLNVMGNLKNDKEKKDVLVGVIRYRMDYKKRVQLKSNILSYHLHHHHCLSQLCLLRAPPQPKTMQVNLDQIHICYLDNINTLIFYSKLMAPFTDHMEFGTTYIN